MCVNIDSNYDVYIVYDHVSDSGLILAFLHYDREMVLGKIVVSEKNSRFLSNYCSIFDRVDYLSQTHSYLRKHFPSVFKIHLPMAIVSTFAFHRFLVAF